MSHLHFIEKKYGIRINLLRWSGDNYEAGTLNALIKIDSTKVGQILLNSIAYHVRHHPRNSLNGVLEIRPYGDGGCQALTSPANTSSAGKQTKPVVQFWPKAYATGGACLKYLERYKEETAGVLPDEALFHELVHAFRMLSGASKSPDASPLTQGGLKNYEDVEEFIAILVTNIYIADPSNRSSSSLRRDHVSYKKLEPDLADSFTFFRSSVLTYRCVEQFCRQNPSFTKNLSQVKAAFNPIAAFHQNPTKAWTYSNSIEAKKRDSMGPDDWDVYNEIKKMVPHKKVNGMSFVNPWAEKKK
jgi:hypothetical protein